ncbi:hypothetical protein CPB85DRAFT_1003838 [Mucidula mucida]|nr:hypothetical protein CPB85DRAFT_1003838 [Mucidula mucida]
MSLPTCIEDLPPEVISQVFVHLLNGSEHLPFIQTFVHAPWLLMHVCSRWRYIAGSLPFLWNSFTVNLGTTALSRGEVLDAYIGYSGTTKPLTIQFVMNRVSPVGDCLLRRLMRESRRWKNITVVGKSRFLPHFQLVRGNLPNLELLRLNVGGKPPSMRCDAFEIAPVLSEVYLQDLAHHIVLPWAQLKRFFAEEDEVEQHVSALNRLEDVQTCTLRVRPCAVPSPPPDDSFPRIILPHLTSMTVNDPNVLHFLNLPSLVDITISQSSFDSESRILSPLKQLLRRSECHLERLSVRSSSQEEWESLATISQLSGLRELDITSRAFPSMFLEVLSSDKGVLSPLESIKIRAVYLHELNPRHAREFVDKRMEGALRMMEIVLGYDAVLEGEWPWWRQENTLRWRRDATSY